MKSASARQSSLKTEESSEDIVIRTASTRCDYEKSSRAQSHAPKDSSPQKIAMSIDQKDMLYKSAQE